MIEIVHSALKAKGCNLACGGKLCTLEGWSNVDHQPSSPIVVKANLLRKLPFANCSFDIVYHSQFIEHLDKEQGLFFLRECYRILRPGGILRIVTPDMENMAKHYLSNLEMISTNNIFSDSDDTKYQWIRLEFIDQLVRHKPGGAMSPFLLEKGNSVKPYLITRLGVSGKNLVPDMNRTRKHKHVFLLRAYLFLVSFRSLAFSLLPKFVRVGLYRTSGEPHLYLYDKYSLALSLREVGFNTIFHQSWCKSLINDWDKTALDSSPDGTPDCPTSLFMEAVK